MAVVCNVLWGSAFPFIKLGYRLFAIDSADTASILCFAGVRFMMGAALVWLAGLALNRRPLPMPHGKTLASACGLGLWQTAAQNNTAVWNAMLYVVMVWWLIFRAMTWFIPWNVFPFIPDVDMIMAGENRGGLYIGFQQFARKITAGLSALAWGWYLGANGFVEEAFKAGGKKADVEPETKKIVEQLTGIKYEKCWPQTAE